MVLLWFDGDRFSREKSGIIEIFFDAKQIPAGFFSA